MLPTGVALYRHTGSLTVSYVVTVNAAVTSGSTVTVSSNLVWWSSPDTISRRQYTTSASTSLVTRAPTVSSFVYYNSSMLPITSGKSFLACPFSYQLPGKVLAGYYDITVGQLVILRGTLALPHASMGLSCVFIAPGPTTTTALSVASSSVISIGSGVSGKSSHSLGVRMN